MSLRTCCTLASRIVWVTNQTLDEGAVPSGVIVSRLDLIGLGLGPLLVGIINDPLETRLTETAVRCSLMIAVVPHAVEAIFDFSATRTLARVLHAAGE